MLQLIHQKEKMTCSELSGQKSRYFRFKKARLFE